MSQQEHLILCSVLAEMTERNDIERAKLAEMRAMRLLQAQALEFEYNCSVLTLGNTLERALLSADTLTAEVLEEEQ